MQTTNSHYETVAKSVINQIYPYLIKDLKNYCPFVINNSKILEIGTGPGFVLESLSKESFTEIYGIDKSLDMIKRAYKRNSNIDNLFLLCSKAENLPFKDETFQIIISRGSMFFWDNLEQALKDIYRTLKTNGFAMLGGGYGISTPNELIQEINSYYSNNLSKTSKPKINIDKTLDIMNKIGGSAEVIAKPQHGFWLLWKK